jgi:hypothetical protein
VNRELRQQVEELAEILRACWDDLTSGSPDWSPLNPALGQCVVTALLVQDEFGGELIRGEINGVAHYWNRIGGGRNFGVPEGVEIDLTRQQFGSVQMQGLWALPHDRAFVLDWADTDRRYRILRHRVDVLRELREAA